MSAILAFSSVPALTWAAPPCTIVGTPGADRLTGTPHADVICGGGGADRIEGRGGSDRLVGGPQADVLIGGSGSDVLVGGSGDDELRGGPGDDRLLGGAGRNSCGADTVTRNCGKPSHSPFLPVRPGLPPPTDVSPAPKTAPDTEPPQLQSIGFANENVEISLGDWWVELSVSAWDESGIDSIAVEIDGPSGPWREVDFAGVPGLMKLSRKLDVPASTPVGEYRITKVTVVDNAGNAVSHGSDWLDAYSGNAQFEVYDGPDREAPNLTGLSFGPTPIDSSSGPVSIQIPIEVADPGSGVERVKLIVAHPTNKAGNRRVYETEPTLVSGTPREGTWLATISLPSGARAGFYPVEELELEDFDHHWHPFDSSSLENQGFPGGFTQVGAADTTKPEITSFSISPQILHTSSGDRKLEVEIGVADDWSGVADWPDPVARIDFWLTPPDWPISWGMSGGATELIEGTDLNGVWHLNRWLEEDASLGTWTVRWITVTDRAGNTTRLEDATLEEFEEKNGILSFENLP